MTTVTKLKTDPPPDATGSSVYAKIAAVQGALARHGIGKDRTNSTPGANYKFRGIDDVYNALAPLLAEHGLCILPRITTHSLIERGKTQKGNPIFAAIVQAEFDFVSTEDGSKHTICTYGEAMDSSDKATNKAMSAAYKYAAFMAFAIPTEGDNDADAHTPEIATTSEMPDHEWAKLVQLIEATKADTTAMLKHYGVENLRHLNQAQYAQAVEALNKKLAKLAKEETNAKASTLAEELGDEIKF